MTPNTATPPQEPEPSPEPRDDAPIIDTSGMSQGQADAMEVAEAARDQGNDRASFAGNIFLGRFDPSPLLPFPEQSAQDRVIGNELVEKVVTFLTEHMDPEEVDETRTIPKHVLDGLTDLGVFRMKVPKEYGGLGFSQVNYNRVIMAIASYCGSTTVQISAHQSIGVPQPLKMFGTDEQKKKYLPRISNGALTAFALTEQDVGSDPAQMKTTATLSDDGKHYLLNGTKLWTTNGPASELLVVMAQTQAKVIRGKERKQITAFIVETNSPGVKVLHRCDFMGIRAIQNGVIQFTDVKVPAENLILGEGKGLKLALKTLNTGRLTLPAACTGMAKQCLMIARLWGNQRVQWGLPVGEHEVGQEKIAYIASTTFAMEAVTWLTSHWADEGSDIRIEAAMAKLFCSETAWKIVDMTMQFRGGRGYERAASLKARGEEAWPVERMMRDCRINTIIEGTSEIMRLFLAREALDPHLRMAADLLRPGVSTNQKLSCAGKLLGFYAKWYPMQLFGRCWGKSFYATGSTARHLRYIDRTSHRLAATMFHAMAINGPKLEKRQVLLGHLMEIGTELFAMSAACAYGQHLATMSENGRDPRQPADVFCRQAKRRIAQHFKATRQAKLRPEHAIAKKVLAGDLRWLEEGVFPVDGDAE